MNPKIENTPVLTRKPMPVAVDHLRPYQKRDYRDVLARCEKVRSVLYVAFMGSGKTVLAAAVIRKWLAQGDRILILTHTREILRQTHDKLVAAGITEEQIGWIWREHPRMKPEAQIQLASLDTLIRRDLPKGITRIVVDEAHHAIAKKWRNVLDAYPKARVLGLTGTPVRLDGQPLGAVFEEMIESEPVESLIEQKWIARPFIWTPEWHVELSRQSGRDFSDLVAAEMIPHARVLESMVAEYSKHAAGLPALGFAATREKAVQYAAHFAASGIATDTLFGSDTDLKRQGTLARLRKGTLRVVWTCNVLGEGWDYPGLRCVMLARPTLSIARFLQQVARCMRPSGSPPVVLDLWGAFRIFDPPWVDFGWSLHARARKSIHVGTRTETGEVEWLPPVEVDGHLVRADFTPRQNVCAGFKGLPCPTAEKPKPEVFYPRNVQTRHKEPWRCHRCSGWHRSNVPVQFLKKVEQKTCAGWGAYICDKIPPVSQLSPSRTWKRKGAPWRCFVCDRRNRSPLRAANPSLYVFSEQIVCPGYDGPCPTSAVATSKHLTPGAVYRRKGKPWRCRRCSNKASAVAPARVAMVKQLAQERVEKAEVRRSTLQQQCPGWRGPCPNSEMCPVSAMAPYMVRRRGRKPWRCHLCAQRRRHRGKL